MEPTQPGGIGQVPLSYDSSLVDNPESVHMNHNIHATASDTNTTTSSAPPTPSLKSPSSRRSSQNAYFQDANANASSSPKLGTAPSRRPSNSTSGNRPSSSPKLVRKSSRSSFGGTGTTEEQQDKRLTPKRSISNFISGLREAQSPMEAIDEPMPLTAAQIASAHFSRELLSHSQANSEAETVVILHDACYGHRWSRLKTPKSHLSLIVERPERIHASVLGASTAYVRLGGHHAGGQQAPHPDRIQSTKPAFDIRRSQRAMEITSPYVTSVHGTDWMSELQGMCGLAGERLASGAKEVARVDTPGQPEKERLHEGDLYLAPGSLDAFQGALGGVADAVDAVFATSSRTKRAFVAVRPPGHHCSADHPSGFCWLNNVHVGIEYAAQTWGLTHAAIFDFDLHHGDGSQAIAWERNSKNNEKRLSAKHNSKLKLSPDIGYYSLHDINSYPCEMGDDDKVQAASLCVENAHSQSIWNVHLQTWKTESDFWTLYKEKYSILLEKAKIFLRHHAERLRSEGKVRPKTAIFISAGFDASEWEGEGMQRHKVNVPTGFYSRFTQDVVKLAKEIDGCDGRVISVLEGGYSDRALCSGVLSHLSGLCASPVTTKTNGVDALMDLSQHMNGLAIAGLESSLQYDPDWWSATNLAALESKINPPPPVQPKKGRTGPQPTYATPTESFAYKVVDTNKFARSISGTMREAPRPVRPPTPPAPEVDWVVATQELSKLLIPMHRQTKSCTAEELAGPKKERKPAAPPVAPVDSTRHLRDRRAKTPAYSESAYSDETASVRSVSRTESRASRRETIDVLPSEETAMPHQRRASRRLSAGGALSFASTSVNMNPPPVPALPRAMDAKPKPRQIPASASNINHNKVRVPPKPTTSTVDESASVLPTAQTATGPRPLAAMNGTTSNPSEMDALTSGMKKVTLKFSSTKEEHDRKLKEKVDADRKARALKAAATRKVNAAAKKAAQSTPAPPPAPKTVPAAVAGTSEMTAVKPQADLLTPGSQDQRETVELREPLPTSTATPASTAPEVLKQIPAKENVQPDQMTRSEWEPPSLSSIRMDPHGAAPAHRASPTELSASNPPSATPIEAPTSSTLLAEHLANTVDDHSSALNPIERPNLFEPAPPLSHKSSKGTLQLGGQQQSVASTHPAAIPERQPLWSNPSAESVPRLPLQDSLLVAAESASWTPRAAKARDLPVFTSTGHIPFATQPGGLSMSRPSMENQTSHPNLQDVAQQDQKVEEKSIWDVPDTPVK